jgi:tetratricopeptide (TPR) repeat protein
MRTFCIGFRLILPLPSLYILIFVISLAACLSLKEFAIHAPTTFYSKTSQATMGQGGSNEFLNHIFEAVRDPQPIVRACAADALSQCLKILMDRQHKSLTGLLCQVHFAVMEGLEEETTKKSWSAITKVEATQHGSLLVISTMIAQTRDFMLPRFAEVCKKVMEFASHPKALMRLEVIRLLPRLARRQPRVFARRYLEQSLDFLLESASSPAPPRVRVDVRPSAFSSIGLLVLAMSDTETGEVLGGDSMPTVKILDDPENSGERHLVELSETGVIYSKLDEIFQLVSDGLKSSSQSSKKNTPEIHIAAFHCAADLVEALNEMALPYMSALIDDMFRAGLSNDLIQCLHAIAECIPEQQSIIEDRLLQAVSMCLAGMKSARDACESIVPSLAGPMTRMGRGLTLNEDELMAGGTTRGVASDSPRVRINTSNNPRVVDDLVLSLQTLGSFGDSIGRVTTSEGVVPLLPFVQKVASQYLSHPSSEVRRAAALTCCMLLMPPGIVHKKRVGGYSARIIEDVLDTLLRVAVSDPSPVVRLCVVRALDSRYDPFLCQAHHLQPLFLLLQDEVLATKATAVQLIGRLAALNPAPILPYMRKFLLDVIVELECGVDTGRGREEATRLLVVFLKSKSMKRLVNPVLPAVVESLPLNGGTPRLASAALEALGELAKAAGASLQPWVKELVPNILATLQDQSSASKQRTSLRTLSLIAGSTGYVIQPYIDYPNLLSQATDILPGTKRAPWALRCEVIRTLGVLGALDPDRYHIVAPKTRKGGAVGGAYFVVQDDVENTKAVADQTAATWEMVGRSPLPSTALPTNIQALAAKTSSSFVTSKAVTAMVSSGRKALGTTDSSNNTSVDNDDDLPVHLSMYEQYAMVAQPVSSLPPARRMTPSDDEFYPTVAIQALMRIFKDPSLANHHGMVMQAIMFIFKSLGLRCVPFLSKVVPHIMLTIRTCGPSNLRESLLKQVATLSGIVREHLRPYVADIFDIVEQFWTSRHLGTIFSLILHIAVGVPDEFRKFLPRLIRRILTNLDEMQVAGWASANARTNNRVRGLRETERLRLMLSSIRSLRGVLGDYLHVLIPALLKLSDSLVPQVAVADEKRGDWAIDSGVSSLTVLALQTTSALLECEGSGAGVRPVTPYWGDKSGACIRSGSLSARVVQPLTRMLGEKCKGNKTIGMAIVETLCVCAKQLGQTNWMPLYHQVARSAIELWQEGVLEDDMGINPPGVDTFSTNDSGLKIYDEIVRTLEASPLQRSYNNPLLHDGPRMARRQDSLLLFGGEPLQPMFSENLGVSTGYDSTVDVFDNSASPHFQQSSKQKINQAYLQRAWDVAQCASRDDWDEWMRRLAIQLLREAPSPALRAAANLAHAYQPLARELFSAAFVCCWKDLNEPYRVNLVHALETAFVADVSPEILQTLLNLAEFMEYDDDGGLPIDIPILADLALKCRAYAKALHYKEREHSMGGSSSCVEALISVNRKLDLPEAALGVLKSATMRLDEDRRLDVSDRTGGNHFSPDLVRQHQTNEMFYSVVWSTQDGNASKMDVLDLAENKELWLAKLGSWTEALEVYEEKLIRNPHDFDAILGCMRCLSAIGEWRRVLELAEDNWPTLVDNAFPGSVHELGGSNFYSTQAAKRDQKKALRMCADAAWRLGRWDDLEKFSSELVHGQGSVQGTATAATPVVPRDLNFAQADFDGAFFSAVLHIHRNEWAMAAAAIDAARKAMDSRFTALMTESYNRAYPTMVTAQTLAEMEEIIEFKKVETGSQGTLHKHPANRINSAEARERLLSVWRDRLAGCRVDADVHSSILAVRSLILGPTDEVDATLTLSELSRQAQRFKLAERVLLDPLAALGADLNGPVFGFGLAECGLVESLELRFEREKSLARKPVGNIIDELVTTASSAFLPQYDQRHEQWSKQLVGEAGGLDRLKIQHRLYFAYLKQMWLTDRRDEAMDRMSRLCDVVDMVSHCESAEDKNMRASCWLELGEWKIDEMTSPGEPLPERLQIEVLCEFKRAITMDESGYRAWHAWALLNFRLALQMNEREDIQAAPSTQRRGTQVSSTQRNHVITAIRGFVKAISLGTKRWSASVQQDMLNLLTCLFRYGEQSSIATIVNECVETVAIDTWLGVLPQLLARIHIKSPSIRSVLHPLLVRLGEKHPQALIYPLSVLLKSPVAERKAAAEALMNSLRSHSSALVEEALMVSSELIRVAILWLETWHEGLEEASRLYFGEGNVAGMLDLLVPLHDKIEKGAETRRESDFISSFGQDLAQAHHHIKDYVRLVTEGGANIPTGPAASKAYDPSGRLRQNEEAETAMNKAWDIYYTVFRRINKQLPALTKLELNHCSPALSRAQSLELGVPGSYRVDGSYVKIEKFIPNVQVITSKQRPRKITIRGSDGKDYVFLLKGHEDLRQDERVMQLFGLVNALLERKRQTKKHDLRIQRYAISPLSHNCGLVGWVPHTDTMHSLIRDYRTSKKTPLNLEHREMLKLAPDYDMLTVMQKVEVFTDALRRTTGKGNDLYEILWLKSTNSEEWLERRTKYTRSLAVMSMVGYILGLGDRHPSNLMLDKLSGRVLHIDFGMYSEKMCILLLAEFDHSSHLSILLSLPVQVTVLKWL